MEVQANQDPPDDPETTQRYWIVHKRHNTFHLPVSARIFSRSLHSKNKTSISIPQHTTIIHTLVSISYTSAIPQLYLSYTSADIQFSTVTFSLPIGGMGPGGPGEPCNIRVRSISCQSRSPLSCVINTKLPTLLLNLEYYFSAHA